MYVDSVVFIPVLENNLTRSDVYDFFVNACMYVYVVYSIADYVHYVTTKLIT